MNIEPLNRYKPLYVFDEEVFENVVSDLVSDGFSIQKGGMPSFVTQALIECQGALSSNHYSHAGIGRADKFQHASKIRGDEICWITGESEQGALWLAWCEALKTYINKTLFMGLFSFESHFACYSPGKYYKRHVDAFRGQGNRVLSLVTYLNETWQPQDGGELILYANDNDINGISVLPEKGTFVVFLSEKFPHEVLPSTRERHSVAGWFRVNGSVNDNIDPPK